MKKNKEGNKFNVLFSFPRSGNSWVRYIVEFISKRPTCHNPVKRAGEGYLQKSQVISSSVDLGVDISKKAILIKRHNFELDYDNWNKDTCRLVFLIRDYHEAILRHSKAAGTLSKIKKWTGEYIKCISNYDQFDGDKILIYYEDLLINPKKEITKLCEFLDIEDSKHFGSFFKNYDRHKLTSSKYYVGGASMTKGNVNSLSWHSDKANPIVISEIKKHIESNKNIYNKYLKRYKK